VLHAQSKQKIIDKMVAKGLTEPVTRESTFRFTFPDCDKLPPPVLPFVDVSFSYSGKKEDYLYSVRPFVLFQSCNTVALHCLWVQQHHNKTAAKKDVDISMSAVPVCELNCEPRCAVARCSTWSWASTATRASLWLAPTALVSQQAVCSAQQQRMLGARHVGVAALWQQHVTGGWHPCCPALLTPSCGP
jgi:hypothetical protein